MTQKSVYKAVLLELAKADANYSLDKAKTEKKTAELLLLKAEVGNLKKKLTTAAQPVFQLYIRDVIIKEQM